MRQVEQIYPVSEYQPEHAAAGSATDAWEADLLRGVGDALVECRAMLLSLFFPDGRPGAGEGAGGGACGEAWDTGGEGVAGSGERAVRRVDAERNRRLLDLVRRGTASLAGACVMHCKDRRVARGDAERGRVRSASPSPPRQPTSPVWDDDGLTGDMDEGADGGAGGWADARKRKRGAGSGVV